MFFYFPLEPYQERYTEMLSGPDGFWETFLKKHDIPYIAIRPDKFNDSDPGRIRLGKGFVLDTLKRCTWSMMQIMRFLSALDGGNVVDGDVLFLDDFWHPGFEALPYARDMYKVKFKIYARCHAQSVDPSDFTAIQGMGRWMRYFEQGIAASLDGIFVNDVVLKELLTDPEGDMGYLAVDQCPIYPIGQMYDSEWVYRYLCEHAPVDAPESHSDFPFRMIRDNIVVFASRWDSEKNPDFFMDLVQRIVPQRDDVTFIVTTGFKELVSNQSALVIRAEYLASKYPKRFVVRENLSKLDYFRLLCLAKVHFNCAEHDFVSYALCESAQFGCMPLFPDYKTYPAALLYRQENLYRKGDLNDACKKLNALLDLKEQHFVRDILTRHDNAIPYAARIMGIYNG